MIKPKTCKIRINRIRAKIYKNSAGDIYGFEIRSHGPGVVCAAVSMLAFNTVNSVENLTDAGFTCEYDEKSEGCLDFQIKAIAAGERPHDAGLLLKSLELGLFSVKRQYGRSIDIKIIYD